MVLSAKKQRYADECFARIIRKKGVTDCVVIDPNGAPVHTTLQDTSRTLDLIGLFGPLVDKARKALALIDPSTEMTMMRVRSHKNEVLITPDTDFVFLVVQGGEGPDAAR